MDEVLIGILLAGGVALACVVERVQRPNWDDELRRFDVADCTAVLSNDASEEEAFGACSRWRAWDKGLSH